jgi:hypothetical protein
MGPNEVFSQYFCIYERMLRGFSFSLYVVFALSDKIDLKKQLGILRE